MSSSFPSHRSPGGEAAAPRGGSAATLVNETSAAILRALRSSDAPSKLRALQHLRKITFHEANRLLLVRSDSGLISALVEALDDCSDECRELILRVFCDLSKHPETRRGMVQLSPPLCRALLAETRGEDPISRLAALTALGNLSEDEQNAAYLLGSTPGLLSNLFELVHFQAGESRAVALHTLRSLTACAEAPRQAAIDVSDMVSSKLALPQCVLLVCVSSLAHL
jgi:hypothetical protein